MTRAAVIVPMSPEAPTALADLANRINAEYEAARNAIGVAANHALAIGEMLVEAQVRVHSAGQKWGEWVEDNLPFGRMQAAKYLRIAKDAPQLCNETRGFHLTREAVQNSPSLRAGLRALTSASKADAPARESKPVRKKGEPRSQPDTAANDVATPRARYLAWLLKQDREARRDDLRLLLEQAEITAKDFAFVTMPLKRG